MSAPVYTAQISRTDATPLMPEQVTEEVFNGARQKSAFLQLAYKLPNMARNQERMPVLQSLPTAYFVNTETDLRQTSKPDWTNKYIVAGELAVIVPIPRNVLDDSEYPIWEQAMPMITEAAGAAIDGAVFTGNGAPTGWPTSIKSAATSAGRTVSLASFSASPVPLYDALLSETGLFAELELQGMNVTGVAAAPLMKGKLRAVKSTTGQPIFQATAAMGLGGTMQGAAPFTIDGSDLTFCMNGGFTDTDFLACAMDKSQVVYAYRTDAQWELFREGVIQDGSGQIIYNLAQQRMVALMMWLRLGWQVPNPPTRLAQSAATRYPAAILTA